ncbi:hypothetical protein LNV08_16510 [Paucibacter sp. TC2R-5]|uniref:hypothetical protein n=1 Tax=Paucibacter sp. TC2R-5 TaxID=2893555 RepID=UPI0021E368BD|nr:hypothetical protein [Paucibacter sp. TC2R-5]MCV2360578.1 hypothetical protein [Paucibacter sp. TC2R-5]
MTSSESDHTLAFLAEHLDAGADAAQIARLFGRVCQEINLALVPIVGQRGVAALFARSLQLGAKSHPWMSDAGTPASNSSGPVPVNFDTAAFCALTARQTRPEAAAAACLLLQTFYELLGKLVGRSLTDRLLRTPWLTFLSGSAAQDNTQ